MLNKVIYHLALLILSQTELLTEVNFQLKAFSTGSYIWDNYLGVSVDYNNIKDIMNTSQYQGYLLNSNLYGVWSNNFALSLKTPRGHKYNCSALKQQQSNVSIACDFETQNNLTYWAILGEFVWNTLNQPNWCIGYDMQGVNLTLPSHQLIFYKWLSSVFQATHNLFFCAQIVDYGDKMVERGYKTAYSPTDFLYDIQKANYISSQIFYSGPGITEDAPKQWLLANEDFKKVALSGHFTVRCIVFKDPKDITLEKILSDNATKYYLRDRFAINESYGLTNFQDNWLGINDIKLATGDGINGLTNSFAAALWLVDIALQFNLFNGWEIDFNHQIREGNFQALLGPLPDMKPTPLYYGMIFFLLIKDGTPEIILPSTEGYISQKIKAWGFSNKETFKVVLLNKDTNTSLNGTVLLKTGLKSTLKCVYMEAPSLTSTDGVKIGGCNFLGGNSIVNGTYTYQKVQYSNAAKGYQIPIKYAQAVMCQTQDFNSKWPAFTENYEMRVFTSFSFLIMIIFTAIVF